MEKGTGVVSLTSRQTLPDPDGGGPQIAPFTAFTYDAVRNLLTSANALGETTQYQYDNLNRQITTIDPNGDATTYGYDAAGNRTRVTDAELNDTTFVFDRLNRLAQETNELGFSRSFAYDAVGNTLSITDRNGRQRQFVYDGLDRLTQEKWLSGAVVIRTINSNYDAAGQLLSTSDPDSAYAFAYDNLGRVLTVSNSGTPGAPVVVFAYAYDAVGDKWGDSPFLSTACTRTSSS